MKRVSEGAVLTYSARPFQIYGATTEKPRSPNLSLIHCWMRTLMDVNVRIARIDKNEFRKIMCRTVVHGLARKYAQLLSKTLCKTKPARVVANQRRYVNSFSAFV